MAELQVGIGAEISGLNRGLNDAENRISQFVSKIDKLGAVGDRLTSIGSDMTKAITLPLLGLGVAAVKSYGDMQALRMGLEAVMGSAKLAGSEMTRLQEVAKLPGLGLSEAVRGSIRLQAIGISAESAANMMMQVGNAVATVGNGTAEFERAMYGIQQLANTKFPLGEDLNIIKDALPQVSRLLKDAFGTDRSDELAKMGKTSAEIVEVITQGLEKLPRVAGGINGAFENMKDSVTNSLSRIGLIIDKNLDISGIIDKISGGLDSIVSSFESLNPTVQTTILAFGGILAVAGPLLVVVGGFLTALPSMIAGFTALSTAIAAAGGVMGLLMSPIVLVTAGIIGIVAAVVMNWDKIKPYIVNTINYFRNLYNESLVVRVGVEAIAVYFKTAFAVVGGVLSTAWEIFKTFAKGTADLFSGVGQLIKGVLTGTGEDIKAGLGKIASVIPTTMTSLANDMKTGVVGAFNDANKYINQGLSNIQNNVKLSNITLEDSEPLAKKVEEKVTDAVTKGVKKANETKKEATLEIPLKIQMGSPSGLIIDPLGSLFTEDQLTALGERMNTVSSAVETKMTDIQMGVAQTMISLTETANPANFIGGMIESTLQFASTAITSSFEAMGEAIGSGGNILKAAGNALLGALGSFLSSLCQQMVQYGIAALAMAVLSKLLMNPITAAPAAIAMIAAGAALSLAGGAIKGTLSKGSGGGSGGGGSTATGGSGGYSSGYSSGGSSGGSGGTVVFRISGQDLVGVLSKQQDRNTRLNSN